MAYSLNDLYGGLRSAMRINGLVVGGGVGLATLLAPASFFETTGIYAAEALWPLRLIGALLLAVGVHLLAAAQERLIPVASMLLMLVVNGLMAFVLINGYLRGEFVGLGLGGQIGLVLLFGACLVQALIPLRYLRTETVVL